jgi:choline dehydrogenase-like flavoprotein
MVPLVQDERRVIVIGSGPAGATAVKSLVEAGIDVTLLESGSEQSARGLTARVAGMTVAKLRRAPLAPRRDGVTATADTGAELYEELAPGGLTNYWSCAVPRFSPEDFADAERAGREYTWPLGYDDLAPWYDRVEPYLLISGPAEGVPQLPAGRPQKAWTLGDDWNGVRNATSADGRRVLPLPYACGSNTTVTLTNNVWNSFVRLVKPAQRSPRLRVRFDAHVLRLDYSPDKRRVEGVVFRDTRTGLEERLPCSAVVLGAGAVNTAQILLASTSSAFPDGLGNTHGVLGRYLHDHPLGKLVLDLGVPISIYPPAYVTRERLGAAEPLYAAACVQWTGIVMIARALRHGHLTRSTYTGFNVFGTMPPSKENFVALDTETTRSNGSAAIRLNVRHPAESERALIDARDNVVELLERARLRPKVRIWHTEPVGHSIHYAGTCRMHASPEYGMLDAWSRLHAVRNVMVADSAAFTTGPEKNPVLTAMALAARGSDKLARDLRAGTVSGS